MIMSLAPIHDAMYLYGMAVSKAIQNNASFQSGQVIFNNTKRLSFLGIAYFLGFQQILIIQMFQKVPRGKCSSTTTVIGCQWSAWRGWWAIRSILLRTE